MLVSCRWPVARPETGWSSARNAQCEGITYVYRAVWCRSKSTVALPQASACKHLEQARQVQTTAPSLSFRRLSPISISMPTPYSYSYGWFRNSVRVRAASTPAVLCMLLALLLQQQCLTAAQSTEVPPTGWRACNSDEQLTRCGSIPLTRRYRAQRRECCSQYRPGRLPQPAVQVMAVASVQQASVASTIPRSDLTPPSDYSAQLNYYINGGTGCPTALTANTPKFTVAASGTYSNWVPTSTTVPNLTKATIQRVKNSVMTSSTMPTDVKNYYNSIRKVNIVNGISWTHPGSGTSKSHGPILLYVLSLTASPITTLAL